MMGGEGVPYVVMAMVMLLYTDEDGSTCTNNSLLCFNGNNIEGNMRRMTIQTKINKYGW